MSGFLGALGGAGEGIAQVGRDWADEAKQKRIAEHRDGIAQKREGRVEQRGLAAEDRQEKRTLRSEARKRKAEAEADSRRSGSQRALAADKHRMSMELNQQKADLGLGKAGQEGASKRDRVLLDAYGKYSKAKSAHDESTQYDDNPEPYPEFEEWASDLGLNVTVGGAGDAAGVRPSESRATTSGGGDRGSRGPMASKGAKDVSPDAASLKKALSKGVSMKQLYEHAVSKGLSEYDVDVLMDELGLDPGDY